MSAIAGLNRVSSRVSRDSSRSRAARRPSRRGRDVTPARGQRVRPPGSRTRSGTPAACGPRRSPRWPDVAGGRGGAPGAGPRWRTHGQIEPFSPRAAGRARFIGVRPAALISSAMAAARRSAPRPRHRCRTRWWTDAAPFAGGRELDLEPEHLAAMPRSGPAADSRGHVPLDRRWIAELTAPSSAHRGERRPIGTLTPSAPAAGESVSSSSSVGIRFLVEASSSVVESSSVLGGGVLAFLRMSSVFCLRLLLLRRFARHLARRLGSRRRGEASRRPKIRGAGRCVRH